MSKNVVAGMLPHSPCATAREGLAGRAGDGFNELMDSGYRRRIAVFFIVSGEFASDRVTGSRPSS